MPVNDENPLRVEDYLEEIKRLSPIDFERRHGDAFLVHNAGLTDLRTPHRAQPTLNEITAVKPVPPGVRPAPQPLRPKSGFVVYEVRSTGRCPFPNMISVGRTRNNDIVISDVTVSKFHAFFTRGRDGQLYLQDAGSRNGTAIGDAAVPGREGKAIAIGPFADVRFGSVDMTFLSLNVFRKFVQRF